jgi:hypothetical protein
MRSILQKFDFRSSAYARPNQTWACGRETEGRPCAIGPDAKGACRADFECRPAKLGDRWHCTRSGLSGGLCGHGPFPDGTCCRPIPQCRPVMNWGSRPGVLARRVAALTLGLLLILMAGGGPAFIDPGSLTFQHGKIQDCARCHTAFAKGPTSWVHAAFADKAIVADSKRCLACHDLGDDSLRPHSLSRARTLTLGQSVNPPSSGSWAVVAVSASLAFGRSSAENAALGCMTCHQEHRGIAADLSAMSGAQCQICHKSKFSSLSDGHPEFIDYPFKRRTRINFDHVSHIDKYFHDKAVQAPVPKECKNCHTPAAGGRLMLAPGFEDGCAACHGAQVGGAGRATAKGLGLFNVPGLDVATLEERGADIGGWPEDADDEMTPFMDFLLAGDDRYPAIRKTLAGLDLLNLVDANDAQVSAAGDLAWLVKELLFDIATVGGPALKARLEKALGRRLASPDLIDLAGLLPVDAVRTSLSHWFPDLYRDVAQHRQGALSATGNNAGVKDSVKEPDILASGEDWSQAGGWYRDDFVLRYRPSGHGDRYVKAWLDVTGNGVGGPGKSAGQRIFESLSDPKSPGLCVKCHSVDAEDTRAGGAFAVNWRAKRPVLGERTFTTFYHTVHFSLLDEEGCLTCHKPDAKAVYSESYKDRNPVTFASNFRPIERKYCINCHTAEVVGDNCLTCHNYHIRTFPPAVANTPKIMSVMDDRPR